MDSELASMNEKSSTELEIMNDDNNAGSITSSINLNEEVKSIFDGLVIEQFSHENEQSDRFEILGETFFVTSSILDINKETERFDNDCKAYILQTISIRMVPFTHKEVFRPWYSFLNRIIIYHRRFLFKSTLYSLPAFLDIWTIITNNINQTLRIGSAQIAIFSKCI